MERPGPGRSSAGLLRPGAGTRGPQPRLRVLKPQLASRANLSPCTGRHLRSSRGGRVYRTQKLTSAGLSHTPEPARSLHPHAADLPRSPRPSSHPAWSRVQGGLEAMKPGMQCPPPSPHHVLCPRPAPPTEAQGPERCTCWALWSGAGSPSRAHLARARPSQGSPWALSYGYYLEDTEAWEVVGRAPMCPSPSWRSPAEAWLRPSSPALPLVPGERGGAGCWPLLCCSHWAWAPCLPSSPGPELEAETGGGLAVPLSVTPFPMVPLWCQCLGGLSPPQDLSVLAQAAPTHNSKIEPM